VGGPPLQGGDGIARDIDLANLLGRHLAAGTPCVLATVVRCEPPTSARAGDKALITADGRLTGWVGGSCAEPLVRREAVRALADATPRLVRIVPEDSVQALEQPGALTVGTTCPSGGALDIFIDPHLPRSLLLVFGDSPAAHTLVQIGAQVGFRACAVHPGGQAEDFPGADLVLSDLDLAPLGSLRDCWAIVATMGHYDEEALETVLPHLEVDVALVASQRRAAATLEQLRARGLGEQDLKRIRTPAGQLRGGTQEEIALLALAEVVALRRERRPAVAAAARQVAASEQRFATDPVCGMAVDVSQALHHVSHAGQTVYFCCAACQEQFERDPGRYLEALTGSS
jgi:xanthine dehydrogenase accessory factor